ncbi:hypothetical protein [Bacillus sp. OAE603]|uniref:hypothetical protein n=1 Tax=Gottfriedia sp. OAE603 TaxID=2663872 RepID=UPI00178B29D7
MEITRSLYKKFPTVYLNYNNLQELYHIFLKISPETRDLVKDIDIFGEERIIQIFSKLLGAKCNFNMYQELKISNLDGIISIFYYTLKDKELYNKLKFIKSRGYLKYNLCVYKTEDKSGKIEFEQSLQIAFIK